MKTALILPGGGIRGAFELGAIQAIFNKIVPDVYIGTSIGAINLAALLGPGNIYKNIDIMTENWHKAKKSDFFQFNPFAFDFLHAKSIFKNETLKRFIKKVTFTDRIENLQGKVYINATRFVDGKNVYFTEGSLVDVIAASCALPPFYSPVTVGGVKYVDGAMGDSLGLVQAKRLGCKQIILVNISESIQESSMHNIPTITQHTLNLMTSRLITDEIRYVGKKNLIQVKLRQKHQSSFNDFSDKEKLIDIGYKEAKKILPKIKLS